ncbi:unnamed protein product [Brassicogethes aeneus]|uniref:Uncharacterized protein n=1 Tax=Brassicogethes aeneus TaxID=1431903 RepID=A0A9P0FR44_BRAAE|nr:unnamed protein product [Brassicogethes aeneus]
MAAQGDKHKSISGLTPHEFITLNELEQIPEGFLAEHSANQMEYNDAKKKFAEICEDYGKILENGKKSQALEFAFKVIYDIEPEARSIKKVKQDKMWNFIFSSKGNDGESKRKICWIHTDKAVFKHSTNPKEIILTVKLASLLAIETWKMLIEHAQFMKIDKVLLTPSAGAIYSLKDIRFIAARIEGNQRNTTNIQKIINASCQPGGHLLAESNYSCALAAVLASTKDMKNEEVRVQIVSKVVKQYFVARKPLDVDKCRIWCQFAFDGNYRMLNNSDNDVLHKIFKYAQKNAQIIKLREVEF